MRLRNLAYDHGWKKVHPASVPVISVGNLTVGGTGKTPTVVLLAKWFREQGIRVAILSRGYGAGADGRNDEARELEIKLDDVPHLQAPDRVASAQVAVEELEMQVLLLDDGFQHRRLARDLDIVLLDATNPFGFGYCLPRGLLRESARSLRRAQVVLITRCDLVPTQRLAELRAKIQRYAPTAAWVESEHRPFQLKNAHGRTATVDSLRGKTAFVFSAIGNPQAFFETLQRCDLQIADTMTFPDHHVYSADDLATIGTRIHACSHVDLILCTGKDLAKLDIDELSGKSLWAVDIELAIRFGREAFEDRLQTVLSKIPSDVGE